MKLTTALIIVLFLMGVLSPGHLATVSYLVVRFNDGSIYWLPAPAKFWCEDAANRLPYYPRSRGRGLR